MTLFAYCGRKHVLSKLQTTCTLKSSKTGNALTNWKLWLCLAHVKYFSEMLFSRKENIFKCLVAL